MASQEFYVTDLKGNKVEDTRALGERITQFVQHCFPDEEALKAQKFTEGRVVIDNEEDENVRFGFSLSASLSFGGFDDWLASSFLFSPSYSL